jgi:hypothetical protein
MRRASLTPFTAAEEAMLASLAHAVWNEIGYDVLSALIEDNPRKTTIPRAHVVELVLDADRMEELARRGRLDPEGRAERTALVVRLRQRPYTSQKRIIGKSFNYTYYGL